MGAKPDNQGEWEVEFYEDENENLPVKKWMDGLEVEKRDALIAGVERILAHLGQGVCATEHGTHLKKGLFEYRLRHTAAEVANLFPENEGQEPDEEENPDGDVLLRVFCHAYGSKVILLVGGYDKGKDPSPKRQAREIKVARKRLKRFKAQQKAKQKGLRGKLWQMALKRGAFKEP